MCCNIAHLFLGILPVLLCVVETTQKPLGIVLLSLRIQRTETASAIQNVWWSCHAALATNNVFGAHRLLGNFYLRTAMERCSVLVSIFIIGGEAL